MTLTNDENKLFHLQRLKEFPLTVTTELTNACMLRCSFCPRKDLKREVGYMPDSLFKKLVDECIQHPPMRIVFDKDGDPLADPNIVKRLKYIKDQDENVFVSFNTPGIHLPDEIAYGLVDEGLGQICFSLLAERPETYEKITGAGLYYTAYENILKFVRIRDELGGRTRVVVKMVDSPLITQKEKADFRINWSSEDRRVDYVTVDREFDWHNLYEHRREVKRTELCGDLFTALNVNWSGSVSMCCLDMGEEWIVGDSNTQTLKEIWDSPRMEDLRRKHIDGRLDDLPCKWCDR